MKLKTKNDKIPKFSQKTMQNGLNLLVTKVIWFPFK